MLLKQFLISMATVLTATVRVANKARVGIMSLNSALKCINNQFFGHALTDDPANYLPAKSRTIARYNQPSLVARYVISVTHTLFGACTENCLPVDSVLPDDRGLSPWWHESSGGP